MKIFWLTGGIGNQLFIYAASKNIKSSFSENVIFDLTNFNHDHREFKLDYFGFNLKKANFLHLLIFRLKVNLFLNFFLKRGNYFPSEILENINNSQLIDFNLIGPVYFSGYWQRYEYYSQVLDDVRKDYKLKESVKTLEYLTL